MTNELLVVTAGRHARLEAVLKTALQGVPFRRYDMAGGALPELSNPAARAKKTAPSKKPAGRAAGNPSKTAGASVAPSLPE